MVLETDWKRRAPRPTDRGDLDSLLHGVRHRGPRTIHPDFVAPDPWLDAGPEGSNAGCRDVEVFPSQRRAGPTGWPSPSAGRRVFRRFRDQWAHGSDEENWYRFSAERQRGRARRWLAEDGIRPVPGERPLSPAVLDGVPGWLELAARTGQGRQQPRDPLTASGVTPTTVARSALRPECPNVGPGH